MLNKEEFKTYVIKKNDVTRAKNKALDITKDLIFNKNSPHHHKYIVNIVKDGRSFKVELCFRSSYKRIQQYYVNSIDDRITPESFNHYITELIDESNLNNLYSLYTKRYKLFEKVEEIEKRAYEIPETLGNYSKMSDIETFNAIISRHNQQLEEETQDERTIDEYDEDED